METFKSGVNGQIVHSYAIFREKLCRLLKESEFYLENICKLVELAPSLSYMYHRCERLIYEKKYWWFLWW
jgi:hypothetical protein